MRGTPTKSGATPQRATPKPSHLGVVIVATDPIHVSKFVSEVIDALPEDHTLLVVNGVGKALHEALAPVRDKVRVIRSPHTFSQGGGWEFAALAAGLRWHALAGTASSILAVDPRGPVPQKADIARALEVSTSKGSAGIVNLVPPRIGADEAEAALRRASRIGSLKQLKERAHLRRLIDQARLAGSRPFDGVGSSWVMGGATLAALVSQALLDHDGLEVFDVEASCLVALVTRAAGFAVSTLSPVADEATGPQGERVSVAATRPVSSTTATDAANVAVNEAVVGQASEQHDELAVVAPGRDHNAPTANVTMAAATALLDLSGDHGRVDADESVDPQVPSKKPQPKNWRYDDERQARTLSTRDGKHDVSVVVDAGR